MAGSGTEKPRLGEIQEERVVAVTGDDNPVGSAPTDSTGVSGDISADVPAADQAVAAESADDLADSDEAVAPEVPTADGEYDGADASEDAPDYIEGLLDVADLDGDIDMDVEGDRPVVSVVGATLTELVGPKGEVLEALQELTRLAVHRQTGARSRIMLDVGGYRARRRQELAELGRSAAEEVSRTGVPQRLDAMTPFERKVVHDAVAAAGLRSESEGEEPTRRVVVLPAEDAVMEPAGGQG